MACPCMFHHYSACSRDIGTKHKAAGNALHNVHFSLMLTWIPSLQDASMPAAATNSEHLTRNHARRTPQLLHIRSHPLSSSRMGKAVIPPLKETLTVGLLSAFLLPILLCKHHNPQIYEISFKLLSHSTLLVIQDFTFWKKQSAHISLTGIM